jgi:hypothetical protein
VTDFPDLFFRPVSRSFPNGIHANENVGASKVLLSEPGLKWSTRDCFGRQNPLYGSLLGSISDENCNEVTGIMERKNILRR